MENYLKKRIESVSGEDKELSGKKRKGISLAADINSEGFKLIAKLLRFTKSTKTGVQT